MNLGRINRLRTPLTTAVMSSACRMKHTLPDLAYDYSALEPHINAEIMELHHSKHHQTYVNNLNIAEEQLEEALAKGDASKVIQLGPALRFNGGGHLNHSIFWQTLSNEGNSEPEGKLLEAIKRDFGSFEAMKTRLSAMSVGIQGSGWGWLGLDKSDGKLKLSAQPNQDPLEACAGLYPLFGIDVWEHAYYLQYKNVRPKYVEEIFKVADWKQVAKRFENC